MGSYCAFLYAKLNKAKETGTITGKLNPIGGGGSALSVYFVYFVRTTLGNALDREKEEEK